MGVLPLEELISFCRRDPPPLWHQLLSFGACALEVMLVRGELLGSSQIQVVAEAVGLASLVLQFVLADELSFLRKFQHLSHLRCAGCWRKRLRWPKTLCPHPSVTKLCCV